MADRTIDSIGPGEEIISQVKNTGGFRYLEQLKPGVRFIVHYADHAGRPYKTECYWDHENKLWRRREIPQPRFHKFKQLRVIRR